MKRAFLNIIFFLLAIQAVADIDLYPSFKWTVKDGTGETVDVSDKKSYEGSAPITTTMTASVVYTDESGEEVEYPDATFYGSWLVWKYGGQMESPDISNPSNPVDFTFRSAETDSIAFVGYVTIDKGGTTETIQITPEYLRTNKYVFAVKTFESKLSFPNAFSPNGDGYNQIFKAKEVQSIVEFHAAIYSRWGVKLYEWDDVNEGWDGTYHGKAVKNGVYYIQVKAKGADGQVFNIKKDVNLLRGYDETTDTTSSSSN